jgi:hypothetical protein
MSQRGKRLLPDAASITARGSKSMRIRIHLPQGTLKLKHERDLRHIEREHVFPTWRLGRRYYVIWWPATRRVRSQPRR